MKMPALSFGSGGPLGWLSRHFEKLLALAIGGFAAILTWWGIQAVMNESVKPERTPEKLSAKADEARRNIEAVTKPPADRIPNVPPLAGQLDAWRQGQTELAPPTATVLIDRPLFQELGKRTKPDVFAIEDLRAVAGIAVLPDPAAAVAGMEPMAQPRLPDAPLEDPRKPPGRPPRGRNREGAELSPFGGGEMPLGEAGVGMGPEPVVTPAPPGKITPFVVITGLIPAAKQQEEFARRFSSASLRDPQRDMPKWGDYRVERAVVVAGAAPQWKEMRTVAMDDPRAAGGLPGPELGPAMSADGLPPSFLLQQAESEKNYVSPLPQRIDEPWGMAAMHPWFAPRLEVLLERGLGGAREVARQSLGEALQAAAKLGGTDVAIDDVVLEGEPQTQARLGLHAFRVRSPDGKTVADPGTIGEADGLVFVMTDAWWSRLVVNWDTEKPHPCNLVIHVERLGGTPVARIVEIGLRDADGAVTETLEDADPQGFDPSRGGFAEGGFAPGVQPGDGRAAGLLEPFRLFRFVDTDVKPGETYRYRVRFALRNPNVGLLPKHLADPKAASGAFLVSAYSNETADVSIPEPVAFLARTVPREAARRLKLKEDVAEVLVLAPATRGNFGLRSAVTGAGGLLDVDPALNKPGDARFFGEPVRTDRVVVDLRGRQEDRADLKDATPPEPLDLLLLRDDGSFELVSAAESERRLEQYRSTLFPPGTDLPDDGRKRDSERPR